MPTADDMKAWRLLDTPAMPAAANVALDAAMLDLCSRSLIPPTLRFLKFTPGAALIGRYQPPEREIREDYCRASGIDISRRITGGGAVYCDTSQIGWEVIAPFSAIASGPRLEEMTAVICGAIVEGLKELGVNAAFRPRNDIEVEGRKISGTGGAHEGPALFFQGTLLVDFDVETMVRALRVPTEKLARREIDSARERVTCLSELLDPLPGAPEIKAALADGVSRTLGVRLKEGGLTVEEEELWKRLLPRYRSQAWLESVSEPADGAGVLHSMHQGEGGMVRTAISVDAGRRRIRSAMFTGDFFISPSRAVLDLESSLKDARFSEAPGIIRKHFARTSWKGLKLTTEDFCLSLECGLRKAGYHQHGIPAEMVDHITVIGGLDLPEAAGRATALLLPYCAKSTGCEFRGTEGCDMCGDCSVGDAYEMAAEAGLEPVTVQNYEHLREVLSALKRSGATSYIGCCCHAFLVKRHRAFTGSGLNAVILDISDTTCYDLGKEDEAYRGRYENQTHLRLELLEAVLELVRAERNDDAQQAATSCGGRKP